MAPKKRDAKEVQDGFLYQIAYQIYCLLDYTLNNKDFSHMAQEDREDVAIYYCNNKVDLIQLKYTRLSQYKSLSSSSKFIEFLYKSYQSNKDDLDQINEIQYLTLDVGHLPRIFEEETPKIIRMLLVLRQTSKKLPYGKKFDKQLIEKIYREELRKGNIARQDLIDAPSEEFLAKIVPDNIPEKSELIEDIFTIIMTEYGGDIERAKCLYLSLLEFVFNRIFIGNGEITCSEIQDFIDEVDNGYVDIRSIAEISDNIRVNFMFQMFLDEQKLPYKIIDKLNREQIISFFKQREELYQQDDEDLLKQFNKELFTLIIEQLRYEDISTEEFVNCFYNLNWMRGGNSWKDMSDRVCEYLKL